MSESGQLSGLKQWMHRIGWGISLVCLLLFLIRLLSQDNWGAYFAQLNWGHFGLAWVLLTVGLGILSQLSYESLRALHQPVGRGMAYRLWFLSQMAKYIPGGIWMFAARTTLYHQTGMPALVAGAASIWEMLAFLLTGLLASLALLSMVIGALPVFVAIVAALGLLAVWALSQLTAPWRWLECLGLKRAAVMRQMLETLGTRRWTLGLRFGLISLLSWTFIDLGFYALVLAFQPTAGLSVWEAGLGYMLAWTVGFLTIFAPGGLGPRELILTIYLTPTLGEALASSVGLMSRLWWVMAEIVHFSIAIAGYFWMKSHED